MSHQWKNIHTDSRCSMLIIEDIWASNTHRLLFKRGIPDSARVIPCLTLYSFKEEVSLELGCHFFDVVIQHGQFSLNYWHYFSKVGKTEKTKKWQRED